MSGINETTKNTSLRRLKANRRNCRNSTGPRTAKGKMQSRMNAVKHGLRSSLVVVRGLQVRERTKDFQKLREQLYLELAPAGPVEEVLVERIVTALWRIRRALMKEAGEIELSAEALKEEQRWAVLVKILRFETTVERQLYGAMNRLERLQRRRNGEQVPPPLTMDVSRRM
jgi:hypothetical protein